MHTWSIDINRHKPVLRNNESGSNCLRISNLIQWVIEFLHTDILLCKYNQILNKFQQNPDFFSDPWNNFYDSIWWHSQLATEIDRMIHCQCSMIHGQFPRTDIFLFKCMASLLRQIVVIDSLPDTEWCDLSAIINTNEATWQINMWGIWQFTGPIPHLRQRYP